MRRYELEAARRIVLLCEGDSEELATEHFLRRQLGADQLGAVALHPINLAGKLEDIFVKAPLFRRQTAVLAVFTLIDLYGMNRVTYARDAPLEEKVGAVRHWLLSGGPDLDADFFHPHVAVHEIEAWFLAEGAALAKRLKQRELEPDPHAETRDFERPPTRRVNDLFQKHIGREYRKIRAGHPLFADLSHKPIYESCRYYREFYDDLVAVARRALNP